MGSIVMAAKVSHVPSIWLSEQPGEHRGIRQQAIDSLRELGRPDPAIIYGRDISKR